MSRSSKKGPWVEERLLAKVNKMNEENRRQMIRTWSRTSTIFPEMVGHTLAVHDRPQARACVRQRVDGRPQAWRVRSDARVPRPRRLWEGALMADEKPNDAKEQPQEEPAVEASAEAAASAEPEQDDAATREPAKPKPRRRAKPKAVQEEAEQEPLEPEQEPLEPEQEPLEPEQEPLEAEEEPLEPEPETREPVAYGDGSARAVRAQAKYVRTSARKARLVCDHLRGKSVEEARAILAFNPRGVARDWSKVLESAIANAENNHELVAEDLVVREAFADEGPTIKRFQPRARGRAASIRKRTSHLTITLSPERR
jgi:ribosomal protein L22